MFYFLTFYFTFFGYKDKPETWAFKLFHSWSYLVWNVLPSNQLVFFTIGSSMGQKAVGKEDESLGSICHWPNEVSDRLKKTSGWISWQAAITNSSLGHLMQISPRVRWTEFSVWPLISNLVMGYSQLMYLYFLSSCGLL